MFSEIIYRVVIIELFLASFANDRLTEVIRHLAADPTTHPDVKKKLLIVLASWKRQFQDDPKMKLVASLYDQCRPHTRRSGDYGGAHSEEIAAREKERELEREREREREREERETAKRLREEAKSAKERAKKEEKEERERKLKEARRPKRRAFNLEQEKPQVLNCIATASQCSSNLVNALVVLIFILIGQISCCLTSLAASESPTRASGGKHSGSRMFGGYKEGPERIGQIYTGWYIIG